MARVGRRQPNTVSKVRAPSVVGPVTYTAPMVVRLSQQLTLRTVAPQRQVIHVLRKPAVVGPIAMYPPVKVLLSAELTRKQLPPQQRIKSILRKPTVVQAPIVPDGITATSDISAAVLALRGVMPAAITATSAITGVVATTGQPSPAAATILTTFATRRHSAHSRLLPPTAIDAAAVTAPPTVATINTNLAAVRTRQDWRRRKVASALRPPTVLGAPSVTVTADQLKIRTKIAPQPRRLPARVAWINPAVINPIILDLRAQVTPKIALVAVDVRRDYKRRLVKRFIKTAGELQLVPAVLTSTSTVSGSVSALSPVVPSSMASTSSMSAGLTFLRSLQISNLTATSVLSANVSGGTSAAQPIGQAQAFAVIHHYYGH